MVRLKSHKAESDLRACERQLAEPTTAAPLERAAIMCKMASSHKQLGNWDESERFYLQGLELRRQALGAEHADTLKVQGLLALLYEQQPRWHDEAVKMYDAVLAARTKALGELHKDTVVAARNRGHFLYRLNRHREAVDAYILLFRKVRKTKGSLHPDTWMALMCIMAARFFAKLPLPIKITGEYKRALLLLLASMLLSLAQYLYKDLRAWWAPPSPAG